MGEPTRFLLVTPVFGPTIGGIQTMMDRLVSQLPASSTFVVAPDRDGAADFDSQRDYQVTRVEAPVGWRGLLANALRPLSPLLAFNTRFLGAATRVARREAVDVVGCAQLSLGPTALWCLLRRRTPYVIFGHADELLPSSGFRGIAGNKLRRLAVSRCHRAVVYCEYAKNLFVEHWGMDPERIVLIPLGTDPITDDTPIEAIDEIAERAEGKKVILTVARLDRNKGQDVVLDALPEVLESVPDTLYLVVGDGPHEGELRAQVARLGLDDKVIFAGRREGAQLAWCYHRADAFTLATRSEAFGFVFLEAQAWGKPIVGTRVGGVPESVPEGETGLLVENENATELAAALVEVLTDADLAARFGEAGKHRIATEMNWSASAGQLSELLEATRSQ